MQKEFNRFEVSGTLENISHLKTGTFLTVSYMSGNKKNYRILIEYTGSLNGIYPKQRVLVKGRAVGRRNHMMENNETRFTASSVAPEKTMLEMTYGEKGRYFYPSHAYAYFAGRVIKVTEAYGWRRAVISADGQELELSTKLHEGMAQVREGDFMWAVCSLASKEETIKNGHKLHTSSIVTMDYRAAPYKGGNEEQG